MSMYNITTVREHTGMNKKTTVDLTEKAQLIKDKYAPVFSLKNILSAGLVLFSELPEKQQIQAILSAQGLSAEDIVSDAEGDAVKKKRKKSRKSSKSA